MKLTREENQMLAGERGYPVQKAMEILVGLGECFDAPRMIPVRSAHLLGSLSIGKAGAMFNKDLADKGARFVTFTDANPLSIEPFDWEKLGFAAGHVRDQMGIIDSYARMGVFLSNTCTPYAVGHFPRFGEHIAWSESSAVVFANSMLGARTNREGGFASIAAALTGRTPEFGYHVDSNRWGDIEIVVSAEIRDTADYGAVGFFAGMVAGDRVPVIVGLPQDALPDQLKHLGAATAASGSVSLFHAVGITPEAPAREAAFGGKKTWDKIEFGEKELRDVRARLTKADSSEIDLVSFGCPHASIEEIGEITGLLAGKKLHSGVELWISTSVVVKSYAEKMGYLPVLEAAGARILCETCPAAAPKDYLKSRGHKIAASNSAKLTFYLTGGQHGMLTHYGSAKQCVEAAITGVWRE